MSKQEENIETTIQTLKNSGATQIECVKALMSTFNTSLKEADSLVLNSKAWSEQRNATLELREAFHNVLISL